MGNSVHHKHQKENEENRRCRMRPKFKAQKTTASGGIGGACYVAWNRWRFRSNPAESETDTLRPFASAVDEALTELLPTTQHYQAPPSQPWVKVGILIACSIRPLE